MENFDNTFLDRDLMVAEEVKEERLKKCHECNLFQAPVCSECNCIVGMMVAYNFKSCPIGKW